MLQHVTLQVILHVTSKLLHIIIALYMLQDVTLTFKINTFYFKYKGNML